MTSAGSFGAYRTKEGWVFGRAGREVCTFWSLTTGDYLSNFIELNHCTPPLSYPIPLRLPQPYKKMQNPVIPLDQAYVLDTLLAMPPKVPKATGGREYPSYASLVYPFWDSREETAENTVSNQTMSLPTLPLDS